MLAKHAPTKLISFTKRLRVEAGTFETQRETADAAE